MRFYNKAEEAAQDILAAFQNPNTLPQPLAQVFIRRNDNAPCRRWSWRNQLIAAPRTTCERSLNTSASNRRGKRWKGGRMDDFATLTQLGRSFGVSSHVIGKWLVEIGLRTREKKPSRAAFERELVKQAPTGRGSGYFYVWHRQKATHALEAAGHRPASDSVAAAGSQPAESAIHRPEGQLQPSPQARLVGPFTAKRSSENGFEIVNGDGTVSFWGYGQCNVEKAVALFNLAYRHGLFGESKCTDKTES